MLIINFKNNIPQQNHYSFSVVGNNKSNKIKFILGKYQDEVDLSEFSAFVKVSADGGDFVDLIPLSHSVVGSEIEIVWELKRKTTQFGIIDVQLSFKKTANDEDIIVWQSAIFGIELLKTIKAEEEVSDKYPTILEEQQAELENHEERIEELEEGGGGESVIITLTKGESVRQIDNKTFLDMCENGLFTSDDLGTIASIQKLINGQTMRIRLIGLNHDVLSNTDLGELEPNGVKAKTTWQFYDMPFQKVNLGLPYEEEKTGYVRSSQPYDVPIEECAEITITPDAPSNMHGYTSAVGLLNAMQEIYNSLPNWLKEAIKTVRKDCFISEMSANSWNYENFDSTGTVIVMENDRYGSCINAKLFCLSATEIGIIPNPQETYNNFPYKIPDQDGNDVMLEGTKYEYFNETYPYTSEPENDRRRPCKYNDQDWYYWLRSPDLLYSDSWGSVSSDGYVNDDDTSYDLGVAPAFCI